MESQNPIPENSRRKLKRTIEIKVRFDEDELAKIKEKAALFGKPLSTYVREVALGESRKPIKKVQRWGNLGVLGNEFLDTREMFIRGAGNDPDKVSRPEVLTLIEKLDHAVEEIKELRREVE